MIEPRTQITITFIMVDGTFGQLTSTLTSVLLAYGSSSVEVSSEDITNEAISGSSVVFVVILGQWRSTSPSLARIRQRENWGEP